MRILTVRQPWATAILALGKDVENRTRNIAGDYRGQVAIHAAMREEVGGPANKFIFDLTGVYPMFASPGTLGTIIGLVDLVDVHHALGQCSAWAESDAWHLVLENPRQLAEPIPYRGGLGLRRLPDEVAAQVLAGVSS